MKGHLSKFWKAHAAIAACVVAVAVSLTVGGGAYVTIHGTKLDAEGQAIYNTVARAHVEQAHGETLPASAVAKLKAINQATALAGTVGPNHPVTLATPEPAMLNEPVVNYSSRNGARPALLVVHDTESPNAAGVADVQAIRAWFNTPSAQASSNYTTDADGNTVQMVADTAKAWTQAYFNPWSISDEMIGYASQTSWPDTQLRAVARIFAAEASKWGIPIQKGAVSGCTITRPGIVQHSNLGACGGGHHDAGPAFPIDKFVALVKQYADGGYHPATGKKTVPPYWTWLAWKLHVGAFRTHDARPKDWTAAVPSPYWKRLAAHEAAALSPARKRAKLRAQIVALRANGSSWQAIEKTATFIEFRNLGGK
jgi:N-acetyl-anhydromuramyl-L-alanine amidase AmpD